MSTRTRLPIGGNIHAVSPLVSNEGTDPDLSIGIDGLTIIADSNGNLAVNPKLALAALTTAAVTVATLPPTPAAGERAFVTDSNAVSFTAGIGAVLAAGGATAVPVVFDGTNWRIG
jgi:hypothetical protein